MVIKPIVGVTEWNTPAWWLFVSNNFISLESYCKKHAFKIILALLLVLAAIFITKYIELREANKPKPIPAAVVEMKDVYYDLTRPEYPDIDKPDTKQTIRLNFYSKKGSVDVAPIQNIDKVITEGISLTPSVKGNWKWTSGNTLQFTADEHFILGEKYTVGIDPKILLTDNVRLASQDLLTSSFNMPNFYANIIKQVLSSDPNQSGSRSAIFTVKFPIQIDKASFEKNISVALFPDRNIFKQESNPKGEKLKFTVSYDKDSPAIAYIKTDTIPLSETEGAVKLEINKGIKGATSSLATTEITSRILNIPDRFGLKIDTLETSIITEGDQDKHIVNMVFNDAIDPNMLKNKISIWLLPPFPSGFTDKQINIWKENGYDYFTDWEVDGKINLSSNDLTEKVTFTYPEFADENPQIAFPFVMNVPANRYVYIKVDSEDIKSSNGYFMRADKLKVLQTQKFSEKLSFTAEGALLPLSGERKVSITTRNHPGAQVEILRLRPNQLQHFVKFDKNYSEWPSYVYEDENEFRLTDYYTKFMRFNTFEDGKTRYDEIDFTPFMGTDTQNPRGIFIVKLRPWDASTTEIQPPSARGFVDLDWMDYETYAQSNQIKGAINKQSVSDARIIVVTDIGILTKRDLDQSWHVFTNSIAKGNPLVNAKVSVIAKNGSTLLTSTTDANGHVHFPPLAQFVNEQEPSHFLVEQDGDFSYLPVFYSYDRILDFSRFDIGGENNTRDIKQLKSHLFSDRGVYRPGDTFNIGIITKSANWDKTIAGIPLEVEIYDSRYVSIFKQQIVLDEFGFNEISYTTDEKSPTGEYSIELYIPGSEDEYRVLLGSTSVNIKEFEPDRLKVNVDLTTQAPKNGWITPKDVSANVTVFNLFGTPAENRRVTAELTLKPIYPYFEKYNAYQFYENTPNRDGIVEQLKESQTDSTGKVNLPLNLNSYVEGTYQMNLLVEAFEAGAGRSVAATTHALVSPYEYLVGFKQDQNLSFINQKADVKIELIAINSKLETISTKNLTTELIEQKYLSVLTQDNSGAYRYESKLKEKVIETGQLAIAENGTKVTLNTSTPGDYVLVLKDNDRVLNRIAYTIAGNADLSRDLNRNAELKVKLDKTSYKRGESITLSINAPYAGSGLITIERDKVYSWQWFKTDTTSTVQSITLPEDIDLEGNAYITVQFVRDINSPEIFMSPLSSAALPFKISLEDRMAKVNVNAPDKLKAGSVLKMEVTTNKPQKIVLFAVDEGILQVARYKLKDPLETFFKKKSLEVRSAEILSLILPEYSKLNAFIAAAGGDGSDEMDLHLNPFKRKKDEPVAFWSHIVKVDGTQTFEYQLPDYFSGKIRIMAVAVSEDQIGITQKQTTVRDDVVIVPNVPTTVAPGDEFEVSIGISNNIETEDAQNFEVEVTTTPELTMLSETKQTIRIEPNRETYLIYKMKANELLGGAEVNVKLNYQDAKGVLTATKRDIGISVRPVTPFRTQIQMGQLDGKEYDFNNIRVTYPNFSKNSAKMSHSPLMLTAGLSKYLDDYPHLCTEQIVSRAIPLSIQRQYPEFSAVTDIKLMDEKLNEIVKILLTRQNTEGAFGLWEIQQNPDPYLTVHAVTYLLEARDSNVKIPQNMLNKSNQYLRKIAADNRRTDLIDLRVRANAVYLLARQGEVVTNEVATIESELMNRYPNEQSDLANFFLAATYRLLKLDEKAETLLTENWKAMTKAYSQAWWNVNYWDPLVIDANRLYLLAMHFPEKLSSYPPQALDNMIKALQDERFTTLSSAMMILALDKYTEAVNKQKLDESLTISAGFTDENQNLIFEKISQIRGQLVTGSFTNAFSDDRSTKAIRLSNQTDLPAWYSIDQSGFDFKPNLKPISEGIEVSHYYTDESGNIVNKIKLGEKINVHIKLRATADEGQTAIALIDLLPGGFEVVHQTPEEVSKQSDEESIYDDEYSGDHESSYKSSVITSSTLYLQYVDAREDRVLIYAYPEDKAKEIVYQIKATNIGKYNIPSVFAEAMYNRRIQAVSALEEPILEVIAP